MKKKLLSFIFAFCLIIPCIFLLNACGNEKKLNYIQVSLADGEYSASIYETRDFGNTTGLNNIKIKAYYSDGSDENVELTNAQITVSFSADGSEESRVTKTFEEYTQMCENSNLTAGFWRLTLKYKDKSCEVNIDVLKVNDTSNYTLNVTSKVGNIGENQIYYGTKFEGIDYSILNGNTQLDDSMIEKICILNKVDGSSSDISSLTQEEIKALPKPSEIPNSENYIASELSNEFSNLEYIEPGKYLIFAEIKEQENYLESYSAYQTLVVKKSPIVATAENFTIDFTFNKDLCRGVTLDEMLHGISNGNGNGYTSYGNSKINGKLSLLFNSDFNGENNNSANDNKLTNETLIWHNFKESWDEADSKIVNYGTLAEVNPKTYNFDSTKGGTNTITTKVKFVPKGDENYYERIYAESEEFEITIILHRTAYLAPTLTVENDPNFKYSTDSAGNPEKMKFELNAPDYALIPYDATPEELAQHLKTAFEANKSYCIYTDAKFEQDESEYLYVCSSAVGSYFIKCYINPNLYYKEKYLTTPPHRNITITKYDKTSENEGYIEYSWTISKGDIAEQSCYSANVGEQIKFNTDNKTVELKFGEYDSYKDVNFVWEAMAVGTNINGFISNITGRFERIDGKDSRYRKFVLETDLATLGSTDNYCNLVIKISYSGDNNWDYFEQYLLVQIYKNN